MTTGQLDTTADLIVRLKVSRDTLIGWRKNGGGPPWIRVGRGVRYRRTDVDAWLVSNEQVTRATQALPRS